MTKGIQLKNDKYKCETLSVGISTDKLIVKTANQQIDEHIIWGRIYKNTNNYCSEFNQRIRIDIL